MKTNSLATASLVFGIIAVIFMWLPVLGVTSLILGISALILSVLSKRQDLGHGYRTAGFVLGVIATTIGAIQLAVIIFFSQAISGVVGNINNLTGTQDQSSYSAPQYVEPTEAPVDSSLGVPMDSDFSPELVVDDLIKDRPISKSALIDYITFDGLMTESEVVKAIETVNPDFDAEALELANYLLSDGMVSDHDSLVTSLSDAGFTHDQVLYATTTLGLK